jgi:hypothetical protein
MRTHTQGLCLSQGTAKLITWNHAVQKCDGSEFARLAARPASFVQEAVRIVDCDNHSTNSRAQNVSLDGTGPGYNLVIKYLLTRRHCHNRFCSLPSWSLSDNFSRGRGRSNLSPSVTCSVTFAVSRICRRTALTKEKRMYHARSVSSAFFRCGQSTEYYVSSMKYFVCILIGSRFGSCAPPEKNGESMRQSAQRD